MRLIYAVLGLLLALVTSAQCQQTTEDWTAKGDALIDLGKHDKAIEAYNEILKLDPIIGLVWAGKARLSKHSEILQKQMSPSPRLKTSGITDNSSFLKPKGLRSLRAYW